MESKLLDLNSEKCCFLLAGSKKGKKKLQKEVDEKPLLLYDLPMKQVTAEKYLGIQLSGSVADSVAATVAKRITLASKMIYEVRAVVEDCRAQVAGGMLVGFQIWESCIPSMLLYGAQVWSDIPKKTISALNKITLKCLRVSCGIGKNGYCTPFLLFECGELLVENRILMMQLIFIFHLA